MLWIQDRPTGTHPEGEFLLVVFIRRTPEPVVSPKLSRKGSVWGRRQHAQGQRPETQGQFWIGITIENYTWFTINMQAFMNDFNPVNITISDSESM